MKTITNSCPSIGIIIWLISWLSWPVFSQTDIPPLITVNIRAQSLESALLIIATENDLQLYYKHDLVAGKSVDTISGRYTLEEALHTLLESTGLTFKYVDDKTIVLKPEVSRPTIAKTAPSVEKTLKPQELEPPSENHNTPPMLEEVVITARRKNENLQRTPMAVTAFSTRTLEYEPGGKLADIASLAANVNTSLGQGGGSSAMQLFIRGIGEIDYMLTTDPAVGLYIDGVYIARTSAANIPISGLQRIEVLRGPQGALYGKNAIGGAISITTAQPSGEPGYTMSLTAGNYDTRILSAHAESPWINNSFAFNASLDAVHIDGWQNRPGDANGGEQHRTTARIAMRWMPSDIFDSSLKLSTINQRQTSYANVITQINPSAYVMQAYRDAGLHPSCCQKNSAFYSNATNPLGRDNADGIGIAWTNQWHINEQSLLRSITGYRKSDAQFGQDYDHSAAEYYAFGDEIHHEQFSHEFQHIGSTANDQLDWIVGVYLFKEQGADTSTLQLTPEAVALGTNSIDLNIVSDNTQEVSSEAVYFHLNYALTDKLEISAGARYTSEEKVYNKRSFRTVTNTPQFPGYSATPPDACSDTGAPEQGSPFSCKDHWTAFSPKMTLRYQYSDDSMFYLSASRGFRSGGFNGRPTSLSLIASYDPEYLDAIELGVKTELFRKKLRINGSFYHNVYKNKQQTVNIAAENAGGVFLVVNNASEAEIDGFEIEASAAPHPDWNLQASIGYTNAKFTQWFDEIEGDLSNRQFPHTPKWSFKLSSDYLINLGKHGQLNLNLSASYKDDIYLDGENSEFLHADSLTLIDAAITYHPFNSPWRLSLIAKNLTDEQEMVSGYNDYDFIGIVHANFSPPRQILLQLTYRNL